MDYEENKMIPKIIHYCWFGNALKSEKMKFCMETWRKFFPDFEIREWSDKDLYLFENNSYVTEAYKAGKWAFVSDVFRLYALYEYGGIYLDTDVEIRQSFEPFLRNGFFIGSEKTIDSKGIGTAVIGADKGNPIIKEMLDLYKDIHFIKPNKNWNLCSDAEKYDLLANTARLVSVLKKHQVDTFYTEDKPIEIKNDSYIYPVDYFCTDSEKSFAVHHFEASWLPPFSYKNKLILPWFHNSKLLLRKYKKNKPNAKITLNKSEKLIKKFGEYKEKSFWCLVLYNENFNNKDCVL